MSYKPIPATVHTLDFLNVKYTVTHQYQHICCSYTDKVKQRNLKDHRLFNYEEIDCDMLWTEFDCVYLKCKNVRYLGEEGLADGKKQYNSGISPVTCFPLVSELHLSADPHTPQPSQQPCTSCLTQSSIPTCTIISQLQQKNPWYRCTANATVLCHVPSKVRSNNRNGSP